jgi:tRNA-uridine 2-sulfurtransferase
MSGGVDSSVAAWLLRQEGHEVIGVFMRHGLETDIACPTGADGLKGTDPFSLTRKSGQSPEITRKQGCCSAADAEDARRVADALGLPFYVLNFQNEFARIVDHFVTQYTAGRTPNPCIVCNTWLKFGKLFEYADSIGAEYVATGHYARLVKQDRGTKGDSPIFTDVKGGQSPEIALCRGLDETKDQSYVLFGIRRELLERLKFPLGNHRKEEIRRIAAELGLRVASKRDSQEICFIPDQDHAGFIRRRPDYIDTSGHIVTTDGKVVGRHDGLEKYTIGQRRGLKLAFGQPRYVIRIEPETRRIVIGNREELARSELTAAEVNWLVKEEILQRPFRCTVKIRYRSRSFPATVAPVGLDRFRAEFDEPCYGIAPGQAAVCYQDDRILGGGWIE